jgi:hypothetical protein
MEAAALGFNSHGFPTRLLVTARFTELFDFFLSSFLRYPVPLLDLAGQLFPASFDGFELVVGQLGPLLLGLALKLFPIPFNSIPVHDLLSCFDLTTDMPAGTNSAAISEKNAIRMPNRE